MRPILGYNCKKKWVRIVLNYIYLAQRKRKTTIVTNGSTYKRVLLFKVFDGFSSFGTLFSNITEYETNWTAGADNQYKHRADIDTLSQNVKTVISWNNGVLNRATKILLFTCFRNIYFLWITFDRYKYKLMSVVS